ncbi:hypothetical protein BH09VER1_BH09VER1_24050 [soil metagenome]
MRQILTEAQWHPLRAVHETRVRPWVEPRLDRMSRQERHPVEDFLFEYYQYRPGQLLRWQPGFGIALLGDSARDYLLHKGFRETLAGITPDASTLSPGRRTSVQWIRTLLRRTEARPPSLGCFGLHEWAMVYRAENIRHEKWPLRLSHAEIARLVEQAGPRCTHFDAFRFFTPPARPLNKFQPTRETVPETEQPGCLHTNMDLYKWAFKLSPFSPSDLVADAFALAREIRQLDMRASPYDFSALGLAPVCIETPEGRAEYEAAQRYFYELSLPLRRRLIALCDDVLAETPDHLLTSASSS